ncbi:hypothetical protein BJ508DRAFT_328920 [Ascobolus immersus RN42]|uniref:Uncharacterized protein n=1 Tax=Ascobolus immersus RN42 TaxID=1160509 RepID=A0A3N4IAF9_ASCIM|nr:hypothetical protein BJ508DRAFT_328920 [Ascobolus immersus RN42]
MAMKMKLEDIPSRRMLRVDVGSQALYEGCPEELWVGTNDDHPQFAHHEVDPAAPCRSCLNSSNSPYRSTTFAAADCIPIISSQTPFANRSVLQTAIDDLQSRLQFVECQSPEVLSC